MKWWGIRGLVQGVIHFPEAPDHEGVMGVIGGEHVWTERRTFHSTGEAARWCERILRGESTKPRWKPYGPVLDPYTPPQWTSASISAISATPGVDDALYRWNGHTWEQT